METHAINLTDEQKMALARGEAVRVQENGLHCVLVREDVYERVRTLLYDDHEWSHEELIRLLAKSAEANGWNEPEMDAYDRYDEELRGQCR